MEVPMQRSLFDLWVQMGPFAKAIVVVLSAMSVAALATAVERLLALRAAGTHLDRLLPQWRSVLDADLSPDGRREAYDRVVRRTMLATGATLRRGMGVLATVGSTAPFVGLVGTVMGIVNAFEQLSASQQGGVGTVSAGIAEALVTTAYGIAVAIPAVWLFNYLTQRVARVLTEIECQAQEVAVATLRKAAQ
jgi:biopolymer transport protein ExbB/TolQ